MQHTLQNAGFWKRCGAFIIDFILFAIFSGFLELFLHYGSLYLIKHSQNSMQTYYALVQILPFVNFLLSYFIPWLYFALMESSKYQGTVGKIIFKIKVTDLDGHRTSFKRTTGRHFAKIISAIMFFIGFIMIAFTRRKQGLHDIMAGTLVLNKTK